MGDGAFGRVGVEQTRRHGDREMGRVGEAETRGNGETEMGRVDVVKSSRATCAVIANCLDREAISAI